ncbi:hypothetical protein ES332_A06G139000v1 [Gossypium tomentosum]|uniref:ribose-5-phosphate isomerase n=3 Tax=Gossypium tomentosum TaxID=34277 RepID=A0A5D2Q3S5_GOSTO|nr:hypothetical protein ES332_A06G139000v1 [Gossypium tomentosum]
MMATTAAAANLPCLPQTWKANNPKGRHKVITWERRSKSPSLTACYCSLSETSPLFRAAKHTIDTYIKSGMVIGLGSGQASAMAIKYLGHQIRAGAFKHKLGIPTSVVSASEAAKAGIPLGELGNSSQIDFAFDDVDIIEERTLISVIGCQRLQGEESIIQEKLVLSMADQIVFMVTENQYKRGLEGSIPVVIESLNWLETAEEIDDLFLGDAEILFVRYRIRDHRSRSHPHYQSPLGTLLVELWIWHV